MTHGSYKFMGFFLISGTGHSWTFFCNALVLVHLAWPLDKQSLRFLLLLFSVAPLFSGIRAAQVGQVLARHGCQWLVPTGNIKAVYNP